MNAPENSRPHPPHQPRIPRSESESGPADSNKAKEETSLLEHDDYEKKTIKNEYLLSEVLIHKWIRKIISTMALAFILILVIWTYHALVPSCWRWLHGERLDLLEEILSHVLFGGIGISVYESTRRFLGRSK